MSFYCVLSSLLYCKCWVSFIFAGEGGGCPVAWGLCGQWREYMWQPCRPGFPSCFCPWAMCPWASHLTSSCPWKWPITLLCRMTVRMDAEMGQPGKGPWRVSCTWEACGQFKFLAQSSVQTGSWSSCAWIWCLVNTDWITGPLRACRTFCSYRSNWHKICSLMCGSCESGFITPISVFLKIFFLYVYFWLRWVFVAVLGLSPVVVRGGFSLWWLLVWSTHSRECGLQ